MESFYTQVSRYGNNLLYRGFNYNGQRVQKRVHFNPTLYVPSDKKQTDWTSLDGKAVEPIRFDSMREAKDFLEKYKDIPNFEIFGNTNYIHQYITETFPNEIKFNPSLVNVCNIDIEVASDDGFPFPENADHPIISIALKMSSRSKNFTYVWGLGDFDPKDKQVIYRKCANEHELIDKFLFFWNEDPPDVITGWNTRLFDIPYVVNRIIKIQSEDAVKMLSPWKMVNYRQLTLKGKKMDTYDIIGTQQLDYFDLFQKFGYSY